MIPIEQLKIYGYEKTMSELIYLDNNHKLPKNILLSGKKGIGKSTLAYHLINYLFSKNEEFKYDTSNFVINSNNKSYTLVKNGSHPSFYKIFLLKEKKNIEISDIRNLISFTNLSTLGSEKKIILIDDIEYLSLNSINALLKVIEEPNDNTHFILIYDNGKKIKDTLKSRCIEFKLSISQLTLKKIINDLFDESTYDNLSFDFRNYFNSANNFINFINLCNNEDLDINNISIEDFLKHIINYKLFKKKEFKNIDFKIYIDIYFRKKIEIYPNEVLFNLYSYFNNRYSKCTKFNLDIESFFLEFNSKLLNE